MSKRHADVRQTNRLLVCARLLKVVGLVGFAIGSEILVRYNYVWISSDIQDRSKLPESLLLIFGGTVTYLLADCLREIDCRLPPQQKIDPTD
jgi:hypothetical protein